MAGSRWTIAGIKQLYVEIDGQRYEVIHYNDAWDLNGMPTAQCVLAVGRDTIQLSQAAVNTRANDLSTHLIAKVFFEPAGDYSQSKSWPGGTQLIFEGTFIGLSYRKVRGEVAAVVQLHHWLADLTYSSTLNKNIQASNIAQVSYDLFGRPIEGSGEASQATTLSSLAGGPILQQATGDDVWAAIKTFLVFMASQKDLLSPNITSNISVDLGENTAALEALARIEGPAEVTTDQGTSVASQSKSYKWSAPLKIYPSAIADELAASMASAIADESAANYANMTFWDLIVGALSSTYQFALVPRVSDALVVPMAPALRSSWRAVLDPDDYELLDTSIMRSRPLRAVLVHAGIESGTNLAASDSAGVPLGIVGAFSNNDKNNKRGTIMTAAAPDWLQRIQGIEQYTPNTTGLKTKTVPKTSMTKGNLIGPKEAGLATAEDIGADSQEFFDRWAQALYITETLRGRSGTFGGKLRWDICPGSNLLIRGNPEQFSNRGDRLGGDHYAMVVKVANSIGAESRIATTQYQVAYLRSPKENQEDATSSTSSPIYISKFTGAPLIDKYLI